jgi:MFS family permease
VKEPPRRIADASAATLSTDTLAEVLLGLLRSPAFRWLMVASSIAMTAGMARTFWEPTLLRRVYGLGPADAGATYLLISTLPSALGTWLGALIADRLSARDRRWYAWVPAIGSAALVPFAVGFYLLPVELQVAGVRVGFVMAVMASLLSGAWSAPVMATAQVLVPPQARAVSAAVWTTVAGFVGGSLGPLLIGDLNMRLQPVAGAESVRWSLAMVAVVPVLAAIAFARLARWMPSAVCVRRPEETP